MQWLDLFSLNDLEYVVTIVLNSASSYIEQVLCKPGLNEGLIWSYVMFLFLNDAFMIWPLLEDINLKRLDLGPLSFAANSSFRK